MTLFGGVISVAGITFLMLSVFVVAAVGYSLGRITIKGVSLGTAGVFIVALLYGAFFSKNLNDALLIGEASYTSKSACKDNDKAK